MVDHVTNLASVYDWKSDAIYAVVVVDIATLPLHLIFCSFVNVVALYEQQRGYYGQTCQHIFDGSVTWQEVCCQYKCIDVRGTNKLFMGTPLAHFYRLTEKSLISLFMYIIVILRLD